MKQIWISLALIFLVVVAVAYGIIRIPNAEPMCWKKYAHEPCRTTWELIKQSFND